MWPFRRKKDAAAEIARKIAVENDPAVIAAGQAAEQARKSHQNQVRKHEQEREAVTQRLSRLAAEDSNHIGMRVLEALTESYHPKGDRRRG